MPASKDWLPSNHEELYDQAVQTSGYLTDPLVRDRIGLGPGTTQGTWYDTEFYTKFTDFQIAFDDWKDPAQRTRLKTERLRETEAEFRKVYRQFYTGFLKESPLVTDEDLIAMGMPARNSGRTPAPVAKTYPDYDIDSGTIRRLTIYFFDQAKNESRGKPDGQHGAEVCWAILDTPPTNVEDLVHSSFCTHSPLVLDFKEDQRGKIVYFCLRWENTRGIKGPWSEILSAVIP
ncbi:MAG: hypothetical protein LBJ00_12830 [Planctomycetaceae bacterium]|jgi:hypothetical protein|nr:hypothetical protein [Planctomycetaceae bacterium]